MHAVRRLTPGMYRRRSAFENHPAAAAFGGGGQACSRPHTKELLFECEILRILDDQVLPNFENS